ncbi:gtrA-like family protein [Mycobacterium ulcerans str. Harvey]|uniref:GtrA-like family protein n=1 Tax=Mycobacterium ulcerans str. Harvey TaxID=1299332 RepID=A0ABN0QXJ2_MYCUL|nr:gtrA-like family protein [Mycobacterium ulcerans str. Harvey]
MSFADATIARLPRVVQPFAQRHHELIKFAIVGGTTFIIDSAIFYTLKLTILEPKPVTAKVIAGIVAVIASYVLNREWSFRDRGGRERHHEALLFFAFSGVGVLLSMAPLWFSSYVLQLRVPMVSLTVENLADFVSAYIIGNLLQMAFRFWAFRRWVFPDEFARNPDKALESALTAGGIAEVFEDEIEGGNVTLLRSWRNKSARANRSDARSAAQLGLPRSPGCRKPRDRAARALLAGAECCRTPTDPVTPIR